MTDTNDHLRDLHKIKKSDVPMFVRPTEGKRDPLLELVDWETAARQLKQQNAKLLAALEAEHSIRVGHPNGWAAQCHVCALLRESRQEK